MSSTRHKLLKTSAPLSDVGMVEFAAADMDAYPAFRDTVREMAGESGQEPENPPAYRYADHRELLRLFSKLQRQIRPEVARAVRVRFYDANGKPDDLHQQAWVPLSDFFGTIGEHSVSDYILHRHFTTHLQPIVEYGGAVVGYECLLRPLPEQPPFRPAELFDIARNIGQHSFLDREARQAAIRFSAAHLPHGVKRFINFLPSSLIAPDRCLNGTFEAIRETGTDPRDLVFEVVETERLDHPELSRIFELYREQGIQLALDDMGDGYATLGTVERLKPDYVKMDRKWVSGCDRDPVKQAYVNRLLERAARYDGIVLAEGVEREEEWQYLRNAGVPLFQGYWFGRAAPIPMEAAASV